MKKHSKGTIIFLLGFFILVGILTSCLKEENKNNIQLPSEIALSSLSEDIIISDFTKFGLWSVSIEKEILKKQIGESVHYALKTSIGTFEFQSNIADSTRLITFLPQYIPQETIENGLIGTFTASENRQTRDSEISVEKVIIIGEETRNATNTYEMLLTHYIQFKDANAYLVFDSEGNLIRPSYVKSSEENAYTLKRYYDARQAASEHTPDDAFKFLRDRPDHEQLLFFGNANRTGYDSTITYREPDPRKRLRELGSIGELTNPANVYNLEKDSIHSQTIIEIQTNRLDSQYDDATFYFSELKESTEYHFSKSDTANVYTFPISFDTTQSTELIKNSRFDCSKNKILRFNSEDNFQMGYTNINTTISEADSRDIIRVADNTIISNTNNDAKITGELNISSKDLTFESLYGDLYTVDMKDLSTRAFHFNHSTSTVKNAIITNGVLSYDVGAGIKSSNSYLTIEDSIIATNTVNTNSTGYYGGGIYLYNSDLIINNSTITNNSIDSGQGGGIAFLSSDDKNEIRLNQCLIKGNSSSKNGAGLYICDGKAAEIKNCSIVDNHISGDSSTFLNGGGISVTSNNLSLTISDTLIASNSALKCGGGLYCGPLSATITNTEFKNNFAQKEGGAVYFNDFAGGQNTLFYSNRIMDNNSTDTKANGIYIEDRSTIYNADEIGWKRFNSPLSTLSFTENTINPNTYSGQGTESGNDITFEGIQTTKGTLEINPNTGEEQSSTKITLDYVIGCEFHGGTLTIKLPTGFEITADASIVIDGSSSPASDFDWSTQQIDITDLNLETGTITLRLENQEIPDGLNQETVSARDVNYTFSVNADADGSDGAWSSSGDKTINFLSKNKPADVEIQIKSGYDYLTLLSRDATELLFDEDTAAQTTAASITEALESTDGTSQQYVIYKADGGGTSTLADTDILPAEATLCVTAPHGNSMEYRVFAGALDFTLVKSGGEQSLYLSLTEAINALETSETGTIYITTSTVEEDELIIDDGKTITIMPSSTISGNVVIDGNSSHRVMNISGNASVTLKDITIQNGAVINENGGESSIRAVQ